MKMMTKVLVLATITLMSASSFAAGAGEQKTTNCPESTTNVVKAQAQGSATGAPAAEPAKSDGKKAD